LGGGTGFEFLRRGPLQETCCFKNTGAWSRGRTQGPERLRSPDCSAAQGRVVDREGAQLSEQKTGLAGVVGAGLGGAGAVAGGGGVSSS